MYNPPCIQNHQNIQETLENKGLQLATLLMFYAQSLNSVLKSFLSSFTYKKKNAPVELRRRYQSNFSKEH